MMEQSPAKPVKQLECLAYSTREAAAMLSISEGLLLIQVRRGGVKAFRIGKRVLIARSELLRLVAERA